jgi:hypothetical protein
VGAEAAEEAGGGEARGEGGEARGKGVRCGRAERRWGVGRGGRKGGGRREICTPETAWLGKLCSQRLLAWAYLPASLVSKGLSVQAYFHAFGLQG